MTKFFLVVPLIAAFCAAGAYADTTTGSDAGETAGTGNTDKGGVDANNGGSAPWSEKIGNALFNEGFSELRPADDAKTRWGTLSVTDQNVALADCKSFQDNGMTGQTAAIESAMEPLSTQSMTAVCELVTSF